MNYIIPVSQMSTPLHEVLTLGLEAEAQGAFMLGDIPHELFYSASDLHEEQPTLCRAAALGLGWPAAVAYFLTTEHVGIVQVQFSEALAIDGDLTQEAMMRALEAGAPINVGGLLRAAEVMPPEGDLGSARRFYPFLFSVLDYAATEYEEFADMPVTAALVSFVYSRMTEGIDPTTVEAQVSNGFNWNSGYPIRELGPVARGFPWEVQVVTDMPVADNRELPSREGPGRERVEFRSWSSRDSTEMMSRMQTLFGAFAERIDRDIIVKVPHGSSVGLAENAPGEPYRLYFWTCPRYASIETTMIPTPEVVLGHRAPVRDPAIVMRQPPDDNPDLIAEGYIGTVFDGDFPAAYVFEQGTYVTFDAVHSNRVETYDLVQAILDRAVALIGETEEGREERKREAARRRTEAARDAYVEWAQQRDGERLNQLERLIRDASSRINDLTEEMSAQMRVQSQSREELGLLQSGLDGRERERHEQEFAKLMGAPKILEVRFENGTFHAFTDDLFVLDEDHGIWHHLGKFNIGLSEGGGLRFENLTRTVERHQAPHVPGTGQACYGNFGEIIPPLAAAGRYADIIFNAIAFLETANMRDTWGATVVKWPVVSEAVAKGQRPIVFLDPDTGEPATDPEGETT